MTHQNPPDHFKGKTVAAHLKEARRRGALATSEAHGTEMPGHYSAGCDSAKNTALVFLVLWSLFAALALENFPLLTFFISFGVAWVVWQTGRSALLGWARLERLHRLIEEERWEIEHHRPQEKEELKEMYAAKGFSGKLLDEVVNVLIADDNRLLRVMLEEELGLSLEVYEHPLKQCTGAFFATAITATALILSDYFWPNFGIPLIGFLTIIVSSNLTARYEKRKQLKSIVWNVSLALLSGLLPYFLSKMLIK